MFIISQNDMTNAT